MPTLDPSREGFTQSGRPIASQRSRQPGWPAATNSTWGSPAWAKSRFRVSLSMQTAEARTSEPT
jgi:hypothetical protein